MAERSPQPARAAAIGVPVALAIAIGGALWFASAALVGRREPWDAIAYWTIAYPAGIAACAVLGYLYPSRPWLWALLVFEGQFLAMCLRNGELGGLWPMGVALFAVVALPGVAAAHFASRQARQRALNGASDGDSAGTRPR